MGPATSAVPSGGDRDPGGAVGDPLLDGDAVPGGPARSGRTGEEAVARARTVTEVSGVGLAVTEASRTVLVGLLRSGSGPGWFGWLGPSALSGRLGSLGGWGALDGPAAVGSLPPPVPGAGAGAGAGARSRSRRRSAAP